MITGARARAALCCALGAGALVAGCGSDDPTPSPTTTTASPVVTSSPPTSSPTSSGPGFDCSSVRAAQDALDADYADELDRLGIKRSDPRAQSVYTVVTTNEGPTYYAAVLAAAPPEELADARLVLDYYTRLAAQVGSLDPGTGSTEDLAAAMDALDRAGLTVNPSVDDATTVVQAQERLQAAVEKDCAGASASPSTSPSTSSSTSTGTPTTTPSPWASSPAIT